MPIKRKKNKNTGTSIAKKIVADLTGLTRRKVVDLSEIRNAKIIAEDLDKTIVSKEDMSRLDPVHAVYVYGQNKMSVLVEQLAPLPAVAKLSAACADADEEYMPSGPPMSPLTQSYFFCWSVFDLCTGSRKESFGTIIIEICKALKVDESLLTIFGKMQASRLGFYMHEGKVGRFVQLRELVTGNIVKAMVASEYTGKPGELWLARVMPDPFDNFPFGYSVVMTTPYVVGKISGDSYSLLGHEAEWLAFFDRTLEKTGKSEKCMAYEHLMKYGLSRHYWNEYIFEAYVNHIKEAIFLAGFPDIALSRPHSRESSMFD